MGDTYSVRPLAADEAPKAFPLVHHIEPDLSLNAWCAFALGRIGPPKAPRDQGILVVETATGYLHGLVSYLLIDHALIGRTLTCDHIAVPDLFSFDAPLSEMMAAVHRHAAATGCLHIQFSIPCSAASNDSRLCRELRAEGYAPGPQLFRRVLPGAPGTDQ